MRAVENESSHSAASIASFTTLLLASSTLASSLFSFAWAAKYTVKEGINTMEKHPTTAASAQTNSVAASTENTLTSRNSSFTVSTTMKG